MADVKNKAKNRGVDDAGIRLAPTPIHNASYHVMPTVMQEFVITPRIEIEGQEGEAAKSSDTANDFQPKKEDISKKWKRRKRSKNMIVGVIMLVFTAAVVLQYVLGAVGVSPEGFPFRYIPQRFGAINNIVEAFKFTAAHGWSGEEVNATWILAVPDLILVLGFIFLAINFIKSVFALLGSVKPIKYIGCATVYLCTVLAVFIASLVGAEVVGIEKIDFVQDFIHGYQSSELFGLIVFAVGYFIVAAICSAVTADKYGYLK